MENTKWTMALEQASTSALARGSNSFNVCHFKCAPHQTGIMKKNNKASSLPVLFLLDGQLLLLRSLKSQSTSCPESVLKESTQEGREIHILKQLFKSWYVFYIKYLSGNKVTVRYVGKVGRSRYII